MNYRSQGVRQPGGPARSRLGAFAALLVATMLLVASCGGDSTTADAGAGAASFPDAEVLSLNDDTTVAFSELVSGGDTPVLLWFYFPH